MTTLSLGAENPTSESNLKKYISPSIQGPGINALIKAIAAGDDYIQGLSISAFNQLFSSSADGIYLDRQGAGQGLIRPLDVGMSDELYRKLLISSTDKQISEVLLEILEIYYGS